MMGIFCSGGKFKCDTITRCNSWLHALNSEADNLLSTSDC